MKPIAHPDAFPHSLTIGILKMATAHPPVADSSGYFGSY